MRPGGIAAIFGLPAFAAGLFLGLAFLWLPDRAWHRLVSWCACRWA